MIIKEIRTTAFFEKHYKKLTGQIKAKAQEKEKIFRENPFHPVLKTHKLHGEKKDEWAFSIDYSYRISFILLENDKVLFTDIGTHDIYK